MNLEEAKTYVSTKAQAAEFPVVTPDEVETIVVKNMRAQVWQAGHEYSIGQNVQPTTPNGHFYKCAANGTSGDEEPDWNLCLKSKTYDGETLIWFECETDFDGNLYNLRNSIYDVWMLKASRVANRFDTSIEGQSWKRSQIHDHCQQMAKAFSPID